MDFLHKVKDYRVARYVQNYYKTSVKLNKNDSYSIIKAKLVRNMTLGKVIKDNGITFIVQYGNLVIVANRRTKTIVGIKNCYGKYAFKTNKEKKKWLNTYLNIKK